MQPARDTSIVERLFSDDAQRLFFIKAIWPRAMGEALAQRAEVIALRQGVLSLRVLDAAWIPVLMQEYRIKMLMRLREYMGSLAPRDIACVPHSSPGRISKPAPQNLTPPLPLPSPTPAILMSAESIADPELRAAYLHTAALYLDRQKKAESDSASPTAPSGV
ncbi:MAG: DUF721 domain-containing protein [Vicinamibacteria bacterium]|nr:DUF721 domain-containing protein [Vicinamibacteria bacterium]